MMKRLTVMILAACIAMSMIIGGCGTESGTKDAGNIAIEYEGD